MKKYLFLIIFLICVGLPSVVAQKHLHNGFVAATSTGVYYLEDGFNEWVELKVRGIQNFTKYDIDTFTSISFYKDELISNGCKSYPYVGNTRTFEFNQYKIFGSHISEQSGNQGYSGTSTLPKKIINNKLKGGYIDCDLNMTYSTIGIALNNLQIQYTHQLGAELLTGIATDSDSTSVEVGTNNTLYKTIISETAGYRSNTSVSGLTSSASSAHQICYDSNQDLFWIVSDEGKVYTYDKTTVTEVDQVPNSDYSASICDSITDVVYSDALDLLVIAVRHADGHFEVHFYDGDTFDQTYFGYGENVHLAVKNDGSVLVSSSLGEYVSTSTTNIDIDNLPSGTIVYDLDYIDYLPWVEPAAEWTYEGVMTIGTDGSAYPHYGYNILDEPNHGSLTPISTDINTFMWTTSWGSVWFDIINVGVIEKVEISGIEYIPYFYEDEGIWSLPKPMVNPFPPVGEPCDIKLKYTTVEPTWAYEGVMTVGYIFEIDQHVFGYSSYQDIIIGSITPEAILLDIVYYYNDPYETSNIHEIGLSSTQNIDISELYINKVVFSDIIALGEYEGIYYWSIENILPNPFPPVGEECTIKLRYTLLP